MNIYHVVKTNISVKELFLSFIEKITGEILNICSNASIYLENDNINLKKITKNIRILRNLNKYQN